MLKLFSALVFSFVMGSCSLFDAEESPEFDPQSMVGTYQYITEESSTYPDSGLLEVELVATTHRDITQGEYTYTQNVHEYRYTERTSDDVIKRKYLVEVLPYGNGPELQSMFIKKQENIVEVADTLIGQEKFGISVDNSEHAKVHGITLSPTEFTLAYKLYHLETNQLIVLECTKVTEEGL